MVVTVRQLGAGDAAAFRALRLEALRLHPEAFGAAWEEEEALDTAAFAARLTPPPPGAVFGAVEDGALLGALGLRAERGLKHRHKALVWGMHVRPEACGRGIGRALLDAVAAHARAEGIERLHLAVGLENAAARRLYAAAGYEAYGLEREALRLGPGRYVDEEMRVLDLRRPVAGG
jgi:ribosomal protein S18 acetylase RimI-like enzyme